MLLSMEAPICPPTACEGAQMVNIVGLMDGSCRMQIAWVHSLKHLIWLCLTYPRSFSLPSSPPILHRNKSVMVNLFVCPQQCAGAHLLDIHPIQEVGYHHHGFTASTMTPNHTFSFGIHLTPYPKLCQGPKIHTKSSSLHRSITI